MARAGERSDSAGADTERTPLARLAAERARAICFAEIPPEVIVAAKEQLLDQLGIGLAAATLPRNQFLDEPVARLGNGGGCTALGHATPMPAALAALRNGTLMHALEYDGTHPAAIVHGGSVVGPVALAVAEEVGASGAALLRAFVLGWELFIRMGLAAPGAFSKRGFQFTAVGGPFAAAFTAGLLLGLDDRQMTNALGIAGSQSGGVLEFVHEGATVKALHAGWAAHAGDVAARLAAAGMTGPATIFEGASGFYRAYTDDDGAPARLREHLGSLGSQWHLREVALKMHPCCHYIQPFLECLETLLEQGVEADAIASVHCEVPLGEEPLICEPWAEKLQPASAYQAKFSLPYALAARLMDGTVTLETFEGPTRPDLRVVAERVDWSPMADGDFPNRYGARVRVTTRTGARHEAEVKNVRGTPERPLTRNEILAKFRDCAGRALSEGAPERVLAAIEGLDRAPDPAALSSTLRDVR